MTSIIAELATAETSDGLDRKVPATNAAIMELNEKELALISGGRPRCGGKGGKDPEVPVSPN
jgi:bacteriocin-like protein